MNAPVQRAIVLRQPSKTVSVRCKRRRIQVVVSDSWEMPAERTLFVAPGVNVPYNLLDVGFHFLERWEAAAPLWRYGRLAADLGDSRDRERTRPLVKDLRVPIYGHELLFVRDCAGGRQLLEAWREECNGGDVPLQRGDERLAFLRALCRVKPIFLALPRSWLYEVGMPQKAERPRHKSVLVKVEISPGRFVRCKPGDEEKTQKRYEHLRRRKAQRRKR